MRMRFPWVTLSLMTVVTLILVACGGGTTTTQSTPTTAATTPAHPSPTTATTAAPVAIVKVQIVEKSQRYAFDPATLTIKKGTAVVWTNTSNAPHTVTSDTGAFNTPSSLMQAQTFKMIFTTAGTFAYHCTIHSYMKGTITVTS